MKSIRNWVCCLFKFEFRGPRWKLAIRIFATLTFFDSVMHRFFVIVSINMLLWKKREKKTFHGCCLLVLLDDNGDKEHSSLTQQRIQLFRRHTVYYSSLQDEGLSTAWAVYIGVCCVLRAAGVFVHLSFGFDVLLASLSMAFCVWLGRDTLAANDQASSCVVLVNDLQSLQWWESVKILAPIAPIGCLTWPCWQDWFVLCALRQQCPRRALNFNAK